MQSIWIYNICYIYIYTIYISSLSLQLPTERAARGVCWVRPLPGTAPHCSPSKFWHAVEPLLLLLHDGGGLEGGALQGGSSDTQQQIQPNFRLESEDCACAALFNLNYLAVNKAQWDRAQTQAWVRVREKGKGGKTGRVFSFLRSVKMRFLFRCRGFELRQQTEMQRPENPVSRTQRTPRKA